MKKYTSIVAWPIAIHILLGAYILCTTVFVMAIDVSSVCVSLPIVFIYFSQLKKNDEFLMFLVQITMIMTLQLFHPCLIANDIEDMSERFMDIIMENDWTGANLKTKKMLLIFMQHLNHPVVKFNLFNVVDVNLNTFLGVNDIK
jgi:hypothetical protein